MAGWWRYRCDGDCNCDGTGDGDGGGDGDGDGDGDGAGDGDGNAMATVIVARQCCVMMVIAEMAPSLAMTTQLIIPLFM